MQIILFSLIVIGLLGYVMYKLSTVYTISLQKILISLTAVFVLISVGIFLSVDNKEDFEELFKEKYKSQFGYEISKISSENIVDSQLLSKTDMYYKFIYIVEKEGKTYVCEANNVLIQKIEDEYVFQPIKEECRVK